MTILRDSAMMLPLWVVLGAALGGPTLALTVLATGLVVLVNLAMWGWMSAEPSRALAFSLPKLLLVLAAFAGLVTAFDPFAVGLSLGSMMMMVAAAGALRATHADVPERLQET